MRKGIRRLRRANERELKKPERGRKRERDREVLSESILSESICQKNEIICHRPTALLISIQTKSIMNETYKLAMRRLVHSYKARKSNHLA